MMANPELLVRASMLVRPGSPDTPQFVDIDCSRLDPSATVEFLVNDVVRGTIPLDLTGTGVLTYIVPPGPVRNALADIGSCTSWTEVGFVRGNILCGCRVDTGDSIQLRYKV